MALNVKEKAEGVRQIIAGWRNYIFENPNVEKEAKRRIGICVDCHYCDRISVTRRIPVLRKVSYIGCTKCRCPIETKTRSYKSACPMGKW